MIPELGNFALILAMCLALAQAIVPIAGAQLGRRDWMLMARPAAAGQFVFIAVAIIVLLQAFYADDFTVRYVAMNSNRSLPDFYKVAALWGGHEGSLLLWIGFLSFWTLAVTVFSRNQPLEFSARVIGVLGIVSVGLMLFALLASNPFDRLAQPPVDGNDLNPLLQDFAMLIHPPPLYMGYVGVAVPFAFAVAALLSGRLDKDWARWTRPWTTAAWLFLTAGIALGSWWAYYELGWGGWWFWDPVENASFMPWLMTTALIHSLAVTEKRGIFKSWTVLLAIGAFALSLFGTFLTRSPILISVHAFASDPGRGLFILALLGFIVGGALLLYATRAGRMEAEGGFELGSRESFLLANNILLVVATFLVLFGTLYPVFTDWAIGEKVSVGPPYFNVVFLVPMLPMVMLLGLGMHASWRRMRFDQIGGGLRKTAIVALVAGIALPWLIYGSASALTMFAAITGLWVCFAALLDPLRRMLRERRFPRLSASQWGMSIAHFGLGIFILGATFTSAYNVESDHAVSPGETWEVGGYAITFIDTQEVSGPNFDAVEGEFELRRNGELVAEMRPQERVYRVQQSPMTEAAIDGRIHRDVFIALGQQLGRNPETWSVRVRVKPLIRFIWYGAFIMALGGIIGASDRRYRIARERQSPDAETAPGSRVAAASPSQRVEEA
ncbi:MAG: heme lyase CcmF/NrfE family subunit [Gammaproteobacteria bacterium]|nr:heme lyase CcmF/NrfE family subunit [Gammaproteobacteria bacterium]